MELHGGVKGQVGLRGHGVGLMVLLGLFLQLGNDRSGPGSYNGHELLLPPLLLLQHALDLLQTGLGVGRHAGQLGHGLLKLGDALRSDAEAGSAVDHFLR